MNTKYILPHFGLGDAIMINGLIRHFCEIYDNIFLFSADYHYESVKYMFRDLENLKVLNFGDMGLVVQNCINYISSNNLQNDLIKVGFEKLYDEMHFIRPDGLLYESYYTMFDLQPSLRYEKFFCLRNEEYENYVYNYLNPSNEEYIFIIDDSTHQNGSFVIDESRIPKKYKIIKYDKDLNYNDERFLLFNYGKIIENAKEVHSMETAFLEFIKSMKFSSNIFVHSYLKKYERPCVMEKHYNELVDKHNFNVII